MRCGGLSGQQVLAGRRKASELQLLGEPVRDTEGVGRRLLSWIENNHPWLASSGHDQRVAAALAFSPVVIARKVEASRDLIPGKISLSRRQHKPYSVYLYCAVSVCYSPTLRAKRSSGAGSVLCLLRVVLSSTSCHKSSDTLCFCSCIIQTLSKVPQLAVRWHLINPGKRSNSHLSGTECTS